MDQVSFTWAVDRDRAQICFYYVPGLCHGGAGGFGLGRSPVSNNKAPSSNLDLRRNHFPALDQMTDQFHILPTFPTYQCMHVSAQLPYVPLCGCCGSTTLHLHTMANFICPLPYSLSS